MKTIEQVAWKIAGEIGESYSLEDNEVILNPAQFATKFLEAYLAQQEPVAHVYLHDIQQSRELGTYAPAYPVPVGTAFNKSVPVFLAPPTAIPEGWQPISTAPKDGTIVIFAGELDHSGDWRMKMGYWSIPECRWYLFGGSWRPTHWQPLPPPPGEKK